MKECHNFADYLKNIMIPFPINNSNVFIEENINNFTKERSFTIDNSNLLTNNFNNHDNKILNCSSTKNNFDIERNLKKQFKGSIRGLTPGIIYNKNCIKKY